LPQLDAGQTTALLSIARKMLAGQTIRVKIADAPFALLRAGKAISAANEKKLRAAHDHIKSAAEQISAVVDPKDEDETEGMSDGDETEETKAAAIADRVARAKARKAQLATS